MSIIAEWNAMSDEQQLDLIGRCISKAATTEHLRGYETAEYIGGTWERIVGNLNPVTLDELNSKRAAEGKEPIKLVSLVYRAARASIAAATYDERKHANEVSFEIMDADGENINYLDRLLSSGHDNTEERAVLRVDMEHFTASLDETDRRILELVAGGYTEREIAAKVLISNVAVHKRIAKMRAALRENAA